MPTPENDFPVAAMVRHCDSMLRGRLAQTGHVRGLMVGCGSGDEVVYLRRSCVSRRIVGCDIGEVFSARARAEGCVLIGDGQKLPFADASFDFVAAFHSLEHVGDPRQVLSEVRRVLASGGWFYMGVPNRSRLIAYMGAFGIPAWKKIAFNLRDFYHQLIGKFENRLGAHAGFSANELQNLLGQYFASTTLITVPYLRFKYDGRLPKFCLDLLLAPGLINYSAAAHYALCRKEEN
ncbi:MAG: class I SAM-dependent methyltransferase [Acidobacteria bacterium]|nr:class I SAM-dependent methyltransferase [Acidobacteriota bacterium]